MTAEEQLAKIRTTLRRREFLKWESDRSYEPTLGIKIKRYIGPDYVVLITLINEVLYSKSEESLRIKLAVAQSSEPPYKYLAVSLLEASD
jgi:hypothetical protein